MKEFVCQIQIQAKTCVSKSNANAKTKSCLYPNSYHFYYATLMCNPTQRFNKRI